MLPVYVPPSSVHLGQGIQLADLRTTRRRVRAVCKRRVLLLRHHRMLPAPRTSEMNIYDLFQTRYRSGYIYLRAAVGLRDPFSLPPGAGSVSHRRLAPRVQGDRVHGHGHPARGGHGVGVPLSSAINNPREYVGLTDCLLKEARGLAGPRACEGPRDRAGPGGRAGLYRSRGRRAPPAAGELTDERVVRPQRAGMESPHTRTPRACCSCRGPPRGHVHAQPDALRAPRPRLHRRARPAPGLRAGRAQPASTPCRFPRPRSPATRSPSPPTGSSHRSLRLPGARHPRLLQGQQRRGHGGAAGACVRRRCCRRSGGGQRGEARGTRPCAGRLPPLGARARPHAGRGSLEPAADSRLYCSQGAAEDVNRRGRGGSSVRRAPPAAAARRGPGAAGGPPDLRAPPAPPGRGLPPSSSSACLAAAAAASICRSPLRGGQRRPRCPARPPCPSTGTATPSP